MQFLIPPMLTKREIYAAEHIWIYWTYMLLEVLKSIQIYAQSPALCNFADTIPLLRTSDVTLKALISILSFLIRI